MIIPQYIDYKKLHDDFLIVYSRVSSAQQDIEKQILLAEAYINTQNIDSEKVIWLKDDDISANKLAMDARPELQQLRMLIKQKKSKTILVYSRDRLARNFYEYVALVKEFYEYGVNVIFTSSKQPPFSKKLAIESLYGIFAQVEGQNISTRRTDTNKQYPSNVFGFKRVGKKRDTKYIPDDKIKNELQSFFLAIAEVKSADDLFNIFISYKKLFKNKRFEDLLRYLNNSFYSGHMETLYGYKKLEHVEPIISLDDFIAIQENLEKLKDELYGAINLATSHGIIIPHCEICKKPMNFRSAELGQSSFYICKNKHVEIKINVSDYNSLINQHLKNVIHSFSYEKLKKDVFAFLHQIQTDFENQITSLDRQVNALHKEITLGYPELSNSKLKSLVELSRENKLKMRDSALDLIKIEEARKDLNEHIQLIKETLIQELQSYNLYYLCQLFFSKIEISNEFIIYHVTFGAYFESEGYDEHRA